MNPMKYLFEPVYPATVAVGRNYEAHTREMGKDPDRNPPFFFTKPADAVVDSGSVVSYPPETSNFHYEIELVVAISMEGFRIPAEDVPSHIYGYAVGIDLTRRDLQLDARDKGRPWDWGKAFDFSAPCAPIFPIAETGELSSGRIWLAVNDEIKQDADVSQLIWDVREIVSIVSSSMQLKPGDLRDQAGRGRIAIDLGCERNRFDRIEFDAAEAR
jgi:fumarylpyruvate hydrolase